MGLWVRKLVAWILLIWIASSTVAIARPCCQDISDTFYHDVSAQVRHSPVFNPLHRYHLQSKTITNHTFCELLQAHQIQYSNESQPSSKKLQPVVFKTHFIASIILSVNSSRPVLQLVNPSSSLYLTTSRLRI